MTTVLLAEDLRKSYRGGDGGTIEVLRGAGLAVGRGEFVAVTGESGSGKSTLLQLLGALDRPSSGQIALDGVEYAGLDEDGLATLRNRQIGFVFQFHHLLRDFTALENVALPLRIAGMAMPEARTRARQLLESVGLGPRESHLPSQLSGGEQQRAAVARALATRPIVLLADEPSGNLDEQNAEHLHALFAGLAKEHRTAMVVVTHNRALAARADRILTLSEGVLAPPVPEQAWLGAP